MSDVSSAIKNTVPISLFNKGLAGRIFEDVRKSGARVVMKNNIAECVLLSPQEYVDLMEELNDSRLLSMANERMSHFDPSSAISAKELYQELGISKEDLKDFEDVEIE